MTQEQKQIPLNAVCVYCGSSRPKNPAHSAAAKEFGLMLAKDNISLVYGGARIGLMGLIADSVLGANGQVVGIIPEHLQKYEVGHTGVTKLHIVENMHVRKKMMFDMSDAFVVLPGGYGTLDEFFEVLTWRQLQMHDKPIILVDIDGYWAPMRTLLDHIVDKGFAQPDTRRLVSIVSKVEDIIPAIKAAPLPIYAPETKWM